MAKLTYLGHAAFLIEGEGLRGIVDPFITGNPMCPVGVADIEVDYVFVTHGHSDHLGDAVEIARRNEAVIVAPYELAVYCQGKGVRAYPMHIGGAHRFPFGRVKLTPALHGSAVVTEEGIVYTGQPCGFLIDVEGKTVYHAGDTGLFSELEMLGERENIEVALLPIGDNFTMGVMDAVYAASLLRPRMVIPMHYGTFSEIEQDPAEFKEHVERLGMRCTILGPGESYQF